MKLKNILIIAMAIVTLVLVVACSDDVVVASKDNNTNFAQVLESNGAFEYAGTKYETLQDAIEAIDKAKGYAPKTIKVLRDGVKTGAATVPSTINGDGIALDLNGNSLSFLSSTGVTVNGKFYVTGEGEITLEDKSAEATAFAVGQGGTLTVENTVINTGDQYAVKASGEGATVDLFGGAIIAGNIAASDKAHIDLKSGSVVSGTMSTSGSDTVVQVFGTLEGNVDALNSSSIELSNGSSFTGNINVLSGASLSVGSAAAGTDPTIGAGSTITVSGANMTANKDAKNAELAMADGATVTVNDGGKIHITAFDNNSCTIICDDSKQAEIIEDADVNIDPKNITDGFFKVAQDDGQIKYFSVLQDAVDSAVATTNNKKVTYVRDRLNTTGVFTDSSATISSALTIDMNGNSDRVEITVSAGTLTVENTSSTASTLVGKLGNGGAGNITIDNVTVGRTDDEVADAVNIKGDFVSTRSTFNATVTVGTLTDGEGSGTAEDPYKNGSTFNGTVNVSGNITLKKSIIAPSITGDDDDFVRSDGDITMYNVAINNEHVGVFAAKGGRVSMTNSTGTAYKIIATNTGSTTLGTITVDNSTMTTGSFTVKDEVAARVTVNNTDYYGDVTIKGYVADTPAVSVDIIDAKNITVSYAAITYIHGQSGTRARNGGSITSDNSVFESVVEASGNLVDGTEATSEISEKKGSTFKNAIRVTGTSSFYKSTFNPSVNATEFYASTVEIKEAVFSTSSTGESTGKLYNIEAKKTETESSADVFADNLKITASTGFVGNLKTSGNTSNTVNELAETYHYYSNIVVDNSSFTAESPAKTLSVGDVSSTYTGGTAAYGDVTIKGGTTANTVTVSSISLADAVKTSYAVVTGDIGTGTPVATVSDGWYSVVGKSVFNGNIYASGAGTFNNSTFDTKSVSDKSVSGSTLSFTSSTFVKDDGTASPTAYTKLYALTASGEDPDANTSALKITTSTGKVASLTAAAGSITVDNTGLNDTTTAADVNFTVAGNVSAKDSGTTYFDITLKGDEPATVSSKKYSRNVVTGTIDGNDIVLNYATVNDNVTAHDNAAVAPAVADLGSVVATNSTFTPSASGKKVSGSTLSFTTSTFTDQINVYALEATGEDDSTSALKITNSTGTVASLTATAGSINVANGSADAALTVTGDVLARVASTTTYYDVALVGNANSTDPAAVKNVVVNGTIDGKIISLTQTTVNNDVTAHSGSVNATSSTFNAGNEKDYNLIADGQVSISNSSFGANGNYRYNVGSQYSGNSGDGITITNSTGSMGSAICTGWSVVINNSGASDNLFITRRPIGTTETYTNAVMAGSSNNHNVVITGPNTAGKKVDITGLISGNNITMRAGTTANGTYDDTTLVVNGIGNNEFYSSASTNIYGGTYGVDESILFSGNGINIHKGTFYVGSYDACLQNVAENIHNSTDYDVKIYINDNINLQSPLVVGLKKGAFNLPATKSVYFLSTSSTHYIQVTQEYNSPSTYGNTNPIVFAGGRIVFNGIDVTTIQNGANSYLDSTEHKIWYKNNGVNIIGITISSTDREFSLNSDIPDYFWGY